MAQKQNTCLWVTFKQIDHQSSHFVNTHEVTINCTFWWVTLKQFDFLWVTLYQNNCVVANHCQTSGPNALRWHGWLRWPTFIKLVPTCDQLGYQSFNTVTWHFLDKIAPPPSNHGQQSKHSKYGLLWKLSVVLLLFLTDWCILADKGMIQSNHMRHQNSGKPYVSTHRSKWKTFWGREKGQSLSSFVLSVLVGFEECQKDATALYPERGGKRVCVHYEDRWHSKKEEF